MTLNELSETVMSGDNYMRFSHLQLENWRNFTHVDVALQQRAFLIGANATGKSNLLDVFRFLRDIVRVGGGFEKAVEDRGGVQSLQSLFSQGRNGIVIDVEMVDEKSEAVWRYRLGFTQNNQGHCVLQEEKVWKAETLLLNRPDEQDRQDKELLRQTHLEQLNANRGFREIANFFNSISYVHIGPQIVREPERLPGRKADPYGSDFVEQIARLSKKVQTARLKRISRAISAVVPQFSELKIDVDKRGMPHLLGKYASPEGVWHTETDFSDGTLRLIGLLWALLDGIGPLLLEEPELSLNQAIVRYIPSILWSAQRGRQILLSTHSEDLLRDEGIAADEILILQPSTNGTEVKLASEIDTVMHLINAGLPILHVSPSRFPLYSDKESDPKQTLVNIARTSRSRQIREDMVPRQNVSGAVASGYAARLIEFTEKHWQPNDARQRSKSLHGCMNALSTLVEWEQS